MYVVDLKELYGKDYHINRPVAINQHWQNGSVFETKNPRRSSGLVYLKHCSATFRLENGQIKAPRGSVVYLPQGARYTAVFDVSEENAPYASQLINLELCDCNCEGFTLSDGVCVIDKGVGAYEEYFDEASRIYSSATMSYSRLRSVIYSLLHAISSKHNSDGIYTKKFRKIADGVTYLEQNLHADVSVESLAKMCYLSTARFRGLFSECMGMSPREYKIKLKIRHAKRLLSDGMLSVKEVARMLGFSDTSYFSKFFKEKTSLSPTEFAERNR